MNNYPPGVTGNEPQIAGYPPCGNCGHGEEEHGSTTAMDSWCNECGCREYDPHPPEPDYPYDTKRERDER